MLSSLPAPTKAEDAKWISQLPLLKDQLACYELIDVAECKTYRDIAKTYKDLPKDYRQRLLQLHNVTKIVLANPLEFIQQFPYSERAAIHDAVIELAPNEYPAAIRALGLYFFPIYNDEAQKQLISAVTAAGHDTKDVGGYCGGYAHASAPAMLSEQSAIREFNTLNALIYDDSKDAKTDQKTAADQKTLSKSKESFIRDITVLQSPQKHTKLYSLKVIQQNNIVEAVSVLDFGKWIDTGSMCSVGKFSGIYSIAELKALLNEMKIHFDELAKKFANRKKAPFVLNIRNNDHRIMVGYLFGSNYWVMADANHQPMHVVKHERIADMIYKGLEFEFPGMDQNVNTGFGCHFYACKMYENDVTGMVGAFKASKTFESLHRITERAMMVTKRGRFTWLGLASNNDEIDTARALVLAGTDLCYRDADNHPARYHLSNIYDLIQPNFPGALKRLHQYLASCLDSPDVLKSFFADTSQQFFYQVMIGNARIAAAITALQQYKHEPTYRYLYAALLHAYPEYRDRKRTGCCACLFTCGDSSKNNAAEFVADVLVAEPDAKMQKVEVDVLLIDSEELLSKGALGAIYTGYFGMRRK